MCHDSAKSSINGTYNTVTDAPQATTEYDAYDRTTKVTLPDGAMTTTAYGIVSHDGEPMLETRVTDALGRHAESYTDEKGRNRETVQHASGDNITVKYDYDAVGQVTAVHHPNGKATTYGYDLLGRKLRVNHPDAGEVTCTYDAAGNLLTKLTAELKKRISDKAPVTYTYDYERLSEVLYPKNLFNRVTYTYGKPGEKYNRAGRLVLVEDASGGEAYYYGNQGEVVKTVRSVMVSTADVRTYVYGATYDSWNRVRTMTYPDGEVVTYHYNAAGQIVRLSGNKQGRESVIVDRIGYDKDGHTVYTKLGNGTETTYTYDKQRERLQAMNLTADGRAVMENKYQYDAVDNILGIANAVDPTKANGNNNNGNNNNSNNNKAKLGGAFNHTYAYDDLNRLIRANGEAKGAKYEMITYKIERWKITGQIHTHQDRSSTHKPILSESLTRLAGDYDTSVKMGALPVIAIGHKNNVDAIYFNKTGFSTIHIGTRKDLLSGRITLSSWLRGYPTKK